jgi:hypothetical protein
MSSCPFCGTSLVEDKKEFSVNSKDALAAIMSRFGVDVLLGRLNAHLPDLAPSLTQVQRRRVYNVYELGAAKILKDNLDAPQTDRERAVLLAVRKLTDADIVQERAEAIIDEFAAALGWNIPKRQQLAPELKPAQGQSAAMTQPTPAPPVQTAASSTPATGIAEEILQSKKRAIQFGSFTWRVLDVQGDKALLLTEDVVEERKYNDNFEDVTWGTSTLRQYLNGPFFQKFSREERERIVEVEIANPDNLWYGTAGGNTTRDRIFLLSLEEADKYFGDSGDYRSKRRKDNRGNEDSNGFLLSNRNDAERVVRHNGEACWWWLRSPGNYSYRAALVGNDGSVYVDGNRVYYDAAAFGGVRPALWLNLKS